jgi:8-oxo-dGTP pyrophosphatase MutT (NUDIX family)
MSVKPWLKRGEAPPLDKRIFKLRTLDVEDPRNGKRYERVVLDGPDWVNVVALTVDEQAVLIRQFRFGTWSTTLEIPGGMVDAGEDAAAAAARELEEETGYRPAKLETLGVTEPNPAIQNNRLHHFLASGCVKVHEGAQEASEDIAVELVPAAKLDAMVRSGEISHSLVVTALYFWRSRQG